MSEPAEESMPQVLKFRLKRATPFTAELGCTFLIFLVMAAVATIGIVAGRSEPGSKNNWVAYVVGGAFGFFALLVLWSWIRQMATRGIKEPMVELSVRPLHIGQSATVALVQHGPATLKSLRANLICVETTVRRVASGKADTRRQIIEDYTVQHNIFDTSHLRVAHGDVWHESREFTVPTEGKPTQGEDTEEFYVRWRIEVWGRAGLIGSFMHPFPVKVIA